MKTSHINWLRLLKRLRNNARTLERLVRRHEDGAISIEAACNALQRSGFSRLETKELRNIVFAA